MDPSTDKQWEIGEGFMHLNNMYLTKFESVSRGLFQPQVWVKDPTVEETGPPKITGERESLLEIVPSSIPIQVPDHTHEDDHGEDTDMGGLINNKLNMDTDNIILEKHANLTSAATLLVE